MAPRSPGLLAAALTAAMSLAAPLAHAAPRPLGVNVHQSTDIGLDATRDAGLGWVRIDLNWLDVEPAPGAYDWTLIDTVVDNAKARGLSVLAVIAYGPSWASEGDVMGDGPVNDVPSPGTYATFVTAAVQHLMGRVTHYEVWNEPNLEVFFEGSPADYLDRVLIPGADAIHAACSSCRVVGPGLASVGGQYDVWMDAVLGAAKDKIDIVSGHAYAGFPSPSSTVGMTSDSFFNKIESHRVLTYDGNILWEGPLSFREVMLKHGVQKPFWLTETGREASPSDITALDEQRTYYRHVLEAMLTRPWWEATIFYEGFDNAGFTWGIATPDAAAPSGYQPKPVMSLLQKVTSSQPLFGGTGNDCDDGLDNEGDGQVDHPADPDCASLSGSSEGLPPVDAGAGGSGGGTGGPGGSGNGGAPASGGAGGGGDERDPGGCACDATGRGGSPGLALAALALGLAIARARSRRASG